VRCYTNENWDASARWGIHPEAKDPATQSSNFVNCAMDPDCKHVCSAIGPTQLNEKGRQLMEVRTPEDTGKDGAVHS